jgi:hypothetical protein
MSFYFTRFVRQIKQTKLKVDMSKQNFNRYLDNVSKNGQDLGKFDLKDHPQDIQNNPYFWKYLAKNKFKDVFGIKNKDTDKNYSSNTYQPANSNSKSYPEVFKGGVTSLATKTKEIFKSIYNSLVAVFKKATNLDIKKSYEIIYERIQKSPALRRIYTDLVYVGTSIKDISVIYINKFSKALEQYKDNKTNLDAKKYYKQLSKQIRDKLENPKHHYIKNLFKNISGQLYSTRILFSNSTEKMNKFVKSGFIEKKFYILKEQLSAVFNIKTYNINSMKDKFENRYYKLKNMTFSDFKDKASHMSKLPNLKNYIKGKFYKMLFYFFGLISTYYFIKYLFYRLRTRSQDKKLEEALTLVKELKSQNETLVKNNEELYNKLNKNY